MPDIGADKITTRKHKRNFIQYGGSRPDKAINFAGQDAAYVKVEGVTLPEAGDITPIWVHDPRRPGKFKLVGRKKTAPDFAEATLVFLEKHGAIPRALARLGCLTLYETTGACKDLSDFVGGWSDYVLVYADGQPVDKDLGERSSWGDSDDQTENSVPIRWSEIFAVGSLGFGSKAAAEVEREVIDVVYGAVTECGSCDLPENYTDRIYAVTRSSGAGSPGTPSEVVYTVDGGANWAQMNITSLGASVTPSAIEIMGQYLIVVVGEEDAYYYSAINSLTGVPDTTWTKVTTGFVAAGSPNDIYVIGGNEAYIVGDGGYIYKITDIASGVSVLDAGNATSADLQRIHGYEDTIVAVGESGAIVKSTNRGATWATTTTSPTSATVRAISVVTDRIFWIGTSGGKVYYTVLGGETWVEKVISGLSVIDDITFVNNNVGYIAGRTSTPAARLYSTWDAGVNFTRDRERIQNYPTHNYINRVAVPLLADATTASNNVAIGGLAANGTDGIILIGAAARQ